MIIEVNNFNLKSTLLSGQCFRVKEEDDNSFTLILDDRVVNLKQKSNQIIIDSNKKDNLIEKIVYYLDLNRDYNIINNQIILKDKNLKEIIDYCKGYKILNQSCFETIISYIISQNNTVKNISKCVDKLSVKFGKKINFRKEEYFLFPTYDELKNIDIYSLRNCGVGFRDKYIINTLNAMKENNHYIENLKELSTEEAMKELMKIKGVGMKVASCILMFAFGRLDAYPIDTWVKKYYNSNNEKDIRKIAFNKYGKYSGIVIQYIFHYSRNKHEL